VLLLEELRQLIGLAPLAELHGFVDQLLGLAGLGGDLGQGRLFFIAGVARFGEELLQLLGRHLVFQGLRFDVLRFDIHVLGRGRQHQVAQRDGTLAHRLQHFLDQRTLGILDLDHMGKAALHLVHVEDAKAGHQHQQQHHPRKPESQARAHLHS
ncbi:conserved hypothetical protein, partial [Ricinus communis]